MTTILQCFIADEEIYQSDKDAMFAGPSLKAIVSNASKGKFLQDDHKVHVEPPASSKSSKPPVGAPPSSSSSSSDKQQEDVQVEDLP
eukprot:CAMPEP_0197292762 /NCGR_PEP_ID=MMETSP0890-20130614/24974_1 /TAXON_ID=44058 ORGANISM="Aureoumbra lagunensis, Strain CCMP1510" /NCGR_SAMPLE_ID=MMETSP0890 /ASSEMBLY_ACC=CAM_ASM_000533 /LENGTH=86 /DNA_ID=CAMNT_0042766919 /DNA_START=532 /DNA_END=792 /DNA_ORIENTATION=+